MQVIKPDSTNQIVTGSKTVFLMGTIDMGNSEDWQSRIATEFSDSDITFFNPRREHWDSSWRQCIDEPEFRKQVTWELDNIAAADIIFCFIGGDSKSPITLMELGMVSMRNTYEVRPIILVCEEEFYRKGNVEIIASRTHGIRMTTSIDYGIGMLRSII